MEKFIESLPKTETHLHIEGAIPWELFEERFPGQFPKVPEFRKPEYRYDSFAQFESILIDHALRIIKQPSDYSEIAGRIFQNHIEQNVRYVELSFHAGIIEFLQMPGKVIIEAIRSAVPAGLEVRVFMGMSRNSYSDYLGSTLEDAVANCRVCMGLTYMDRRTCLFWTGCPACGRLPGRMDGPSRPMPGNSDPRIM